VLKAHWGKRPEKATICIEHNEDISDEAIIQQMKGRASQILESSK